MKITRLKSGYRIRLTDSEFAALRDVFSEGQGNIEAMEPNEWRELDPAVRRGWPRITGPGSWAVDDRRG